MYKYLILLLVCCLALPTYAEGESETPATENLAPAADASCAVEKHEEAVTVETNTTTVHTETSTTNTSETKTEDPDFEIDPGDDTDSVDEDLEIHRPGE